MAKLIVPRLGRIYETLGPITEPLIRVAVGLSLVLHGYPKLFVNPEASAEFFEDAGFSPGEFWNLVVGLTETVGGLCLAAGFLTRLVCIPIAIFALTAIGYHLQFGYYWNNRGVEYPLLLTLIALHFLVRGGGRWSADARIGREF